MSPNRYRCPIHDAVVRFNTDHWVCTGDDGHETRLAVDTDESELVRFDSTMHAPGARTVMDL